MHFEERFSLKVHIGEGHMEEEELAVQLLKAFPEGTSTCALCQEMCGSVTVSPNMGCPDKVHRMNPEDTGQ